MLKFESTGAIYKWNSFDGRAKYIFTAPLSYPAGKDLDENADTDRCMICGFEASNEKPFIVLHMLSKHWDNPKVRAMYRNRSEEFKREIKENFPHIDFDKE